MDPLLLLAGVSPEDDEMEEQERAAALMTIMIAGALEAREIQNARRRAHRLYLCRRELLPDPRSETPWQRLWESQTDRAFITTMGFDVATFRYILEGPNGFGRRWNMSTIPREDVDNAGNPRLGRRSLDGAGALGLVLHYLGSAMLEITLQQIFALTPATLSRYLDFALDILYDTLPRLNDAAISFPCSQDEFDEMSNLITARHSLLEGAFGSIDGLSLAVEESDDPEIENATYNGWKSDHRINNVLVFSPKGDIMMAVLNCPGSWHDSHVARPIFKKLLTDVPDGYFLVADTAFPRGTLSIQGKIRAPIKAGERIPADPMIQAEVLRENRQLLSYRQTAEWGMRTVQGGFGRLRIPLPISSENKRLRLLGNICRLTNIRARRVGISQIRNVYMPLWEMSEDERLWADMKNMLFGEVIKRDRVSRFHLVVDNNE
ncbi:hypothetical protein H0H93_015417 [Arthromyces matolae]|nr:hypothetical protein H0H93_015417 [Arthromyces matolae]